MRKFLVTHQGSGYNDPICRWVDIDSFGRVEGETPIEDFGTWILLEEEITPKEGFELILALLLQSEGSYDYRGDPIDEKPTDYLTSDKTLRIWKEQLAI